MEADALRMMEPGRDWQELATLNLLSHIPLQSCLSLLCSSKHSRVALDLLDAILSLRNNSYWLVKVLRRIPLKGRAITCKNYVLKIYSQHANFLNAI